MTELYDLVELSYNVFSYYITWVHAVWMPKHVLIDVRV